MGDGKSNPFASDGKSGADGNGAGGKFAGLSAQRGPDRAQRVGPPDFNPDSVAPGGRILKLDPPSDRQGLVGQMADEKGGMKHKPFKLGGSAGGARDNASPDEAIEGTVGDIPSADASE
jgi:hypothetical protein